MVQKPGKKLIYFVTATAFTFTAIIVVVAINYHLEAIEHDTGPINRLLNIRNVDDEATVLMHTKKGIIVGKITSIDDNLIMVKNNQLQWRITTDSNTVYRASKVNLNKNQLKINDTVTVLGDTKDNSPLIKAILVREN